MAKHRPPAARRVESRETQAAPASPAATALWITLVVLVTARALLALVPSMAGWGLNVARFLPAWAAWPLMVLAALALVPAIARRAVPAFEWIGERLARGGMFAVVVAAFFAMALVLALPDRVWYVGDFLLRQGAIEQDIGAGRVFPQALPLDRVLHNVVPTWLGGGIGFDANSSGRLLGAFDAAILMTSAIAFARALDLRGAIALATVAVVFFGGYLAVFTGYSKAIVELCALTAATGACALRVLRSGTGVLALGIVLGVAFLLHRSAIALLPAALLTWAIWLRDPAARTSLRSPATIAGLVLPWLALAVTLPRALRTFLDVDLKVHLAPAAVQSGGVLATALHGTRPLDVANLLMMLAPLGLVGVVLLVARGRGAGRTRELLMLIVLAAPLVAVIPLVHPVQGMLRDWDNFVAGGVALSMIAAWLVAETLRGARDRGTLAVGVAACAAAFTLQWMIHHADVDRGMRRMRAFLDEPPARSEADRVTVYDYLGIRNLRLERYAAAAEAFRAAADLVPNPRFMIQWGIAATEANDLHSGREAYERMIARTPNDPLAWRGYTAMTSRLGDLPNARRGANRLLELTPGDPAALALIAEIDRIEAEERAGAPTSTGAPTTSDPRRAPTTPR